MAAEKPREIALRVLWRLIQTDQNLDRLLEKTTGVAQLESRDRNLVQELVLGVTRQRRLLDYLIKEMVPRSPKPKLALVLQLGLYQLLFLSRVPGYAVLNEMVGVAKRQMGTSSGRFVNAVLRRAVRELDQIRESVDRLKSTRPGIGYSCPQWLYRRWSERMPGSDVQALLEWQNRVPEVLGRVNQLAMTPESFAQDALTEGIEAERVSLSWPSTAEVCRFRQTAGLVDWKLFQVGGFYIQDPSTLRCVDALAPEPGERILDLCAAPGGKTTYIAEKLQNRGEIAACDVVEARLERLKENCRRLGVTNTTFRLLDESGLPADWEGRFDRVLADVPCSNTGVLRRRVDLRWRLQASEFPRMRSIQADLIRRAASAVRSGGVLVYSTCSIEPEENRGVVEDFLTDNPSFELEDEAQLNPAIDQTDGAYFARLRRK